jgi:hypothetical protein
VVAAKAVASPVSEGAGSMALRYCSAAGWTVVAFVSTLLLGDGVKGPGD